ncbi:MAG TPA: hypothetical protein VHX59_27435 [Mycobacteriales bacterium]|jgi:hypothetical protein|nr:hypothetical protein [Mycobacteriales bacterium]
MRATVARRTIAGAAVALALTLSAGACGGGVDKDKLVTKLKTDADFKSLPDSQVKCIADVAVKYGDKSKINDYINGKRNTDDGIGSMSSKDEKKAEAAAKKCVQK